MNQTVTRSEGRHPMSRSSLFLVVGIALFLAGGAVLALGDDARWTSVGTSLGIAGLALMGWVWWKRGDERKG